MSNKKHRRVRRSSGPRTQPFRSWDLPDESFSNIPFELRRPDEPDVWTFTSWNVPNPHLVLKLDGTYAAVQKKGKREVLRGHGVDQTAALNNLKIALAERCSR